MYVVVRVCVFPLLLLRIIRNGLKTGGEENDDKTVPTPLHNNVLSLSVSFFIILRLRHFAAISSTALLNERVVLALFNGS